MERYVIFYSLASGHYDKVFVDAESSQDATSIADAFSCKTGAIIVGVCPEFLLNKYYHE